MGKKKSGRVGGIRLEVKPTAEIKASQAASTASVNNGVQKPIITVGEAKRASSEAINIEMDVESPLEKLMSRANDEASLKVFAQAWRRLVEEKLELRAANADVSYEEFEKLISSKKLDSNLKKCTAFVRKMKQYNESQKYSIENDLKTLNLTKYLSEIASAVTEARFKISEILDVIIICSWIHQRYSEFGPMLLENYKKAFPAKKIDVSAAVLSKLAVDLRMVGDLVVCGILSEGDGFSLIVNVLRNMMNMDKEGMQCLIPILSFCRGMGDVYVGVIPRSISHLCDDYRVSLIRSDLFPTAKKDQLRAWIKEYFSNAVSAMLKMHKEVQNSELHNRRLLRSKGEIHPDRKEAHYGIVSKFEKYHANVVKFANVLNEDLPELPSLPADPEEEEEKAMLLDECGVPLGIVPGIVLFDDEETRSFYQDFKDLKVYLPPVAYRENIQQAAEQTQAIEEREKALANFDDALEQAEEAELKCERVDNAVESEKTVEDEAIQEGDGDLPPSMRNEKEETEMDKQLKPSFQVFLSQLPNCVNRNMIDKAAMEFAECHNNKANRRKLANTLFRVPRQRMDLIPFYSRFVAILAPVMPDLGLELCQLLKSDFKYLVRKKHQIFIETKVKITRFIGELVNFRIFPKSDALQCLKILLMDFVHHQIEMACVFVETCGRFLHRTPDSHRRTKIYLEEMMRKKTVKSLEPRYVSMIDHAYFYALPPEGGLRTAKKKPPLEAYLDSVIYDNLSKDTIGLAITQLSKLAWNDDKVASLAKKYLSMPWKVTYQQLPWYAKLIIGLRKAEPEIVQTILDTLLEDIRCGIERYSVKYNHRRISTIRFLAELYNYRLITSATMFDILYMLITYGTSLDVSRPSPLDPPDNLFRIRLACYILKEAGDYLNQGNNKKKFKCYLKYLQRYFWFKKDLPIWGKGRFPYGTQELWEDIVQEALPRVRLAQSFEEAQKEVEEMEEILKGRMNIEDKEKIESVNRLEVCDNDDQETVLYKTQNRPSTDPRHQGGGQNQSTSLWNPDGDLSEFGACGGVDHPFSAADLIGHYNSNGDPYNQYGSFEQLSYPDPNISNEVEQTQPLDPYDDYELAIAKMKAAQQIITPEDEEFIMMLESMCSEVNHSATRDGGKYMKTDIPIPLHIRNSSHSTSTINVPSGSDGPCGPAGDSNTVPFVLITRKGNKQQFKTLAVPANSDFVQKIKTREEIERLDKESVKLRTLAMTERQEQEERDREQEAMQQVDPGQRYKKKKNLRFQNRKKLDYWNSEKSLFPAEK